MPGGHTGRSGDQGHGRRELADRQEWTFFASLYPADRGLATVWWALLVLRGLLPAAMAVAMGYLIGAVQHGDSLAGPLTAFGIVFVALQVLNPIHAAVSADLGDRMAAWLYDELTETCLAPPGIGHLEDAELANDLQVAREFDRGMTGPPLRISLGFIADGLALLLVGWPRPRSCSASPGGRRRCWPGPGWPPTGCCGRAGSGRTATPRRSVAPNGTPSTPTGWRSTRRRPRSCGSSGCGTGPSTASSPVAPDSTSCSTRPPGCGSARC